jgi:hypothetical protein
MIRTTYYPVKERIAIGFLRKKLSGKQWPEDQRSGDYVLAQTATNLDQACFRGFTHKLDVVRD